MANGPKEYFKILLSLVRENWVIFAVFYTSFALIISLMVAGVIVI